MANPATARGVNLFGGCSHLSRLIFGFGLLFSTMMMTSIQAGTLFAVVAGVLIRLIDGHWQRLVRVLRLLRWFVIPILLLHLMFTPGTLLLPDLPFPISREGVIRGVTLAVHLIAIYLVAVLMFRLLEASEWLQLAKYLPGPGRHLTRNALMIVALKQGVGRMLRTLRDQFRLRSDWKQSPLLLIAAFRYALADASHYAQMLWLRWPTRLHLHRAQVVHPLRPLRSLLLGGCGCIVMALPWLN